MSSTHAGPERLSPLWQLFIARLKEFLREPEAVFWVYGFPLLMTLALGIAYRTKPPEPFKVDVEDSPGAEALATALTAAGKFDVHLFAADQCARRLKSRDVALVVRQEGTNLAYIYDADQSTSGPARMAVDDALQEAAGRKSPRPTHDQTVREPGGRYIDFLVPGLLGMGIMGGGLWGVGFVTVDMRIKKLLKRFLATPMSKSDFLAAVMMSRIVFLLPEVSLLLTFAYFVFDVRVIGSWLEVIFLIVLGSVTFAGVGLLVASRARTVETVSGLMNLVMLPMWMLSGIFFPATNFPASVQPLIRILPLTALLDALRPLMIEGDALTQHWPQVAILAAWAACSFALALRFFRWT